MPSYKDQQGHLFEAVTEAQPSWDTDIHINKNVNWTPVNSWAVAGSHKKDRNLYPAGGFGSHKEKKPKRTKLSREQREAAIPDEDYGVSKATKAVVESEAIQRRKLDNKRARRARKGDGPYAATPANTTQLSTTFRAPVPQPHVVHIQYAKETEKLLGRGCNQFEPSDFEVKGLKLALFANEKPNPPSKTLVLPSTRAGPKDLFIEKIVKVDVVAEAVIREACVKFYKIIQVDLHFRVKTNNICTGDEPVFNILKVCRGLHDYKNRTRTMFLADNAFMIELSDLNKNDNATRYWPMNFCVNLDCHDQKGNCVYQPRDDGRAVQKNCMRKPLQVVKNLWMSDTYSNFDINTVQRVLKPFKSLKVIGFDMRGENARRKENEHQFVEFDAPSYLVKALQTAYEAVELPELREKRLSVDPRARKRALADVSIRIAAESEERAKELMAKDGPVAMQVARWNEVLVPKSMEERALEIAEFCEDNGIKDPSEVCWAPDTTSWQPADGLTWDDHP